LSTKNIKFYIFFLIFIFSDNVIAEILDKSGANIFMYHRFDESKYPSTNIDTKELESHLIYLKENNFTNLMLLSRKNYFSKINN